MNLNPIALDAGAEIMRLYANGFAVETKSDASPVTEADRAAEAIILKGLATLAPDIPVIAEEEAAAGRLPDIGQRFFLVDPLDGTREFISRNGEFTVNIALIEQGQPVAGVVYAPALGRLFWGQTGNGAFSADVTGGVIGEARPIHVRKAPQDGLRAIGSRSHGAAETQAWLKPYNIRDFVSAGSSLKFCLLAAGEADLYPRLGRTMEWDTAAGHAVLNAAGGRMTRLDGTPFLYGKRHQVDEAAFANPCFVAFGDPDLAIL